MKQKFSKTAIYFSVFIVLVVLVFVFQNMDVVTVDFFFWEISLPRAMLLSLTLIIGILLGLLIRSGHRSIDK